MKWTWIIISSLIIVGIGIFIILDGNTDEKILLHEETEDFLLPKDRPSIIIKEYSEGFNNFKMRDNGLVNVDGKNFGFAITGKINEVKRIKTNLDFNWTWTENNYTYLRERTNQTTNESYNDSVFVRVIEGYNNEPTFNWTQRWEFDEVRDAKFTNIITNNLGTDITEAKFWYITEVEKGRLRYKGKIYDFQKDIHLTGDFNDRLAFLDLGIITFEFYDLIENGFVVKDIYVGSGDIVGLPNKRLVALGVTKGNSVLRDGVTIELDPTVTSFKTPLQQGLHQVGQSAWRSPENITLNDNEYASGVNVGNLMSSSFYGFDDNTLPNGSIVHGIEVSVEHKALQTQARCVSITHGVELSYDNYTDFTIRKTASQGTTEALDIIGGLTDIWGAIVPDVDNFRDKNFTLRHTFVSQSLQFGIGDCNLYLDRVRVRINFTLLPPTPTFVDPTPANNSVIGSTLRVNITTDLNVESCKIEHNASGSFINFSMNPVIPKNCIGIIGGLAGIENGTGYDFRVYVTNEGLGGSGGENFTDFRTVVVESNPPLLDLNNPENGTSIDAGNVTLNWTIIDIDGDDFEFNILGYSNISFLEYLIVSRRLESNGTFTYNWTSKPVDSNSEDLYALYHLDNRSDFTESETQIFDFSGNNRNGTITLDSGDSEARPVYNGQYGKSYSFNPTNNDVIKIGENGNFSDVCNNGCTFSAWINITDTTGDSLTILGRADTTSDNNFFNFHTSGVSNDLRMFFYEDGTSGSLCSIVAQTSGVSVGVWTHVATKWNQSDIFVYINGVLEGQTTCSFTSIDQSAWQDSEDTFIGGRDDGGVVFNFEGEIDDVAIWNRTLSDSEILNLTILENGVYFWNVTAQDTPTQINRSETRQFTIPIITSICTLDALDNCEIDCASDVMTENIDLDGKNLSFIDVGSFSVSFNFTQIDKFFTPEQACYLDTAPGGLFSFI